MDSKTKIVDVVTGQVLAVRPAVLEDRISKVGSKEELLRTYVGRDTKRMLRDGKTVNQIRKELKVDASDLPSELDLADVVSEIIAVKNRPVSATTKTSSSGNLDDGLDAIETPEDVKEMLTK